MSRLSMSRPAPSVPKTWVQVPLLNTGGCKRLDRFVSIGSNGAITSAKMAAATKTPSTIRETTGSSVRHRKGHLAHRPTEGGSMALSRLGDVIVYPRVDVGV